jgi:LiaI-LiaF-like transmembrane region
MNCAFHPEVENAAFCIKCGKALCAQCVRQVQSSIYCESCLAESLGETAGTAGSTSRPIPPLVQTAGGGSPEAAFLLGLIPGVGAIFNAEYFKAALHLLIFGTLVTAADHAGPGEALFALLAFGFYVYMPFEAFYTAKKRKLAREGINLITPFDSFNEQFGDMELWGGIALVVMGVIFLLHTFDILPLEKIGRIWPVLLILAGLAFIRRFLKGKA